MRLLILGLGVVAFGLAFTGLNTARNYDNLVEWRDQALGRVTTLSQEIGSQTRELRVGRETFDENMISLEKTRDDLADIQRVLSAEAGELRSQHEALAGQTRQFEEGFGKHLGLIDQTAEATQKVNHGLAALRHDVEGVSEKVSNSLNTLEALTQTVLDESSGIKEKVNNGLEAFRHDVDGVSEKLSNRLNTLETLTQTVRDESSGIREDVETQLAKLGGELRSDLPARVGSSIKSALEKEFTTQSTSIEALKESIEALDNNVRSLPRDIPDGIKDELKQILKLLHNLKEAPSDPGLTMAVANALRLLTGNDTAAEVTELRRPWQLLLFALDAAAVRDESRVRWALEEIPDDMRETLELNSALRQLESSSRDHHGDAFEAFSQHITNLSGSPADEEDK